MFQRPHRLIALICMMCVMLCGCGIPSGTDEFAEGYLQKFKNGDYEGMYNMLNEDVKLKSQFSDFESWHKKVIDKLGSIEYYKKVNWQFMTFPGGIQVTLSYEVIFSKSKGIVNVVVVKKNNRFSLMNTNINSPGLVN